MMMKIRHIIWFKIFTFLMIIIDLLITSEFLPKIFVFKREIKCARLHLVKFSGVIHQAHFLSGFICEYSENWCNTEKVINFVQTAKTEMDIAKIERKVKLRLNWS